MSQQYYEYSKSYPTALGVIADCLGRSHLSQLENIALRFSHALEENALDLKDGNEREFLSAVLVKTVNEIFATIGSLRHGALLSCYHHPRSIFELFAAIEHIYCNSSKRQRKLEKFVEYPKVARYLYFQEWNRRLSVGEISEEQFTHECCVSERDFHELSKRIPEWRRIWKLKDNNSYLDVIRNWHYPATIEGLFQSSEETKQLWQDYEMICHAAHLSPLGDRVVGGHLLIGFPRDDEDFDFVKINRPIDYAIIGAQRIAICLYQKVKAGLIEGVLEWVPGD